MIRRLFVCVVLLAAAACTSVTASGTGPGKTAQVTANRGDTLTVTYSLPDACLYDVTAETGGKPAFLFGWIQGPATGTVHAQVTASGSYDLSVQPSPKVWGTSCSWKVEITSTTA